MARSISPAGLSDLVKAGGWAWQPQFTEPLDFLLTYPIRWLPVAWQVVALNFFGAVCAAISLGLLARIVTILPHDRTRDQRFFERSEHSWLSIPGAWVPPVLAVLVCGLQLTFWEHSVISTGESLHLLLFAFVVWNLLEYRVDRKEWRLSVAALTYGAGLTSSFILIPLLPAFVVAVAWLRGLSFFQWRFLLRMTLFALGGLSLYLLLPLIHVLEGQTQQSFIEILRVNLGFQKDMLSRFPRTMLNLMLISVVSIVPVFFMAIRWPASFGDTSAAGTALTNLMMHVLHGIFLVACLAVAFDPPFSTRKLTFGMFPMLPFYFLGAISIGYFAGYFLLVFGAAGSHPKRAAAWRRHSKVALFGNRAIAGVVWLALVAAPAGLAYRNYPHIRANTRPYLSQMGELQARALKEVAPRGAIVLSDDPFRLYALDAALRRQGGGEYYVLLDTSSLPYVNYHRHLSERYPQQWIQPPAEVNQTMLLDPYRLVELMRYLGQSREIYYLHPSFGYYFEFFYLKPRNLVYEMKPCPTNAVEAPLPTAEELAAQDRFWTDFKATRLGPLLRDLKTLRSEDRPNDSLALAGSMYSRAVNDFAAVLQLAGQLEKAQAWFATALELNPQNPAAYINREYNEQLLTGQREGAAPSEGVLKRLAPYGGKMNAILNGNGPVSQPQVCFRLAEDFASGRNFRQAAQQLLRILNFTPDNLAAHVALVNTLNQLQWHDAALARITQIRARFGTNVVNAQLELMQAEAMAHLGRKEFPTAEKILLSALTDYPRNPEPFLTLAEIYVNHGQMTNAASVLDRALAAQPDQPQVLNHYARLKILNNDYQGAIPYLDRTLEQNDKDIYALLNRAIAHLKIEQLDQAQRDYEALQALAPKFYPASYGLHEVYWRKKQSKPALKYARQFLKLAPPGSAEVQEMQGRLAKLESGAF